MRKIHRAAPYALAVSVSLAIGWPATADDVVYLDQNRDRGFSLPGVALPQGQDEVRAADGTSCRSAVGGSGAYLDMGAIKGQMDADTRDVSTYARVVFPLGARSSRLDCSKLYKLEIERLEMELRLLKMGGASPRQINDDEASMKDGSGWTHNGWTRRGVEDAATTTVLPSDADKHRRARRG